ncbi:hypothetical protein, partial [Endozoicomonas sp. YOMI1]|uniref:hypothetical protein n=1 Tax=Endozoicomonas sp. YOMI1 TaxID=2828739 RepID=UPI0021485D7E
PLFLVIDDSFVLRFSEKAPGSAKRSIFSSRANHHEPSASGFTSLMLKSGWIEKLLLQKGLMNWPILPESSM